MNDTASGRPAAASGTSTRRKRKVAIAVVGIVAIGGAAFAYWTQTGTGAGTAATGSNDAITVNQTSVVTDLAPGGAAQTLSGDFDNPNDGPVFLTDVTVSIASVTSDGEPIDGCDATDYTLANATMPVGAEVPSGDAQGAWSGATIAFNNKVDVNQDACKGATVNLTYAAS